MKKIITVLAIVLVIISCKKSEEEGINNKLGGIKTLPHSQIGEDITLNGEIISRGIPAATEYGFLLTPASTTDSSLIFKNNDIITESITDIPILYPTDKSIKAIITNITKEKELDTIEYKYIAYIRNYDSINYGGILTFTFKGPNKKEPEMTTININSTTTTVTFKGILKDTTMTGGLNPSIKEVGFVISRNPSFIPSEATKYPTALKKDFKKIFEIIKNDSIKNDNIKNDNIIGGTKYYVRTYATYNTDNTFYSYKSKDTIVGTLDDNKKIETVGATDGKGLNIILKSRIISFGKPASTEYGFLLTKEDFDKHSLVFNADNKTADDKITIIHVTADLAGNIEYSLELGTRNYKYRAWIRNSEGVEYGVMMERGGFTK